MKIVSWNINGLRTRIVTVKAKKIIECRLISEENPDIICFQETRCSIENAKQFENNDYPYQFYNESRGENARGPNRYSGTAVWSKTKPISVSYNFEGYDDNEGRVIILKFKDFLLINVYTPNSGTNFENRLKWQIAFLEFFKTIKENIVFCGDMNVAYDTQDTYFDRTKVKPMAGILPEEIEFIKKLKELNFVDATKEHNYTWWNPRCKKENGMSLMRNRNKGWKIDHFFLRGLEGESTVLKHIGEEYATQNIPLSSDHAPILLTLT